MNKKRKKCKQRQRPGRVRQLEQINEQKLFVVIWFEPLSPMYLLVYLFYIFAWHWSVTERRIYIYPSNLISLSWAFGKVNLATAILIPESIGADEIEKGGLTRTWTNLSTSLSSNWSLISRDVADHYTLLYTRINCAKTRWQIGSLMLDIRYPWFVLWCIIECFLSWILLSASISK